MKHMFVALFISLAAGGTVYAADQALDGTVTRDAARSHADAMFTQMDANKDGKLDQADRQDRRAAIFDRLDSNHDGQISREEFRAAPDGPPGMGMGQRGGHRMGQRGGMHMNRHGMADANKDGALSREEFIAAALQRFDRADTDHDGRVTSAERQAMRLAWREGMWGGPAMAPQVKSVP